VILGADKRQYIVDHHHLARALRDEDVKQVLVTVLENLSGLEPEAFWFVLENRGLTHPYDESGRRRACADIPRPVRDLIDDPFRSLASELRRAGGFAKETMSFSELLWADFLRRRIERKLIESDFDRAMEKALELRSVRAQIIFLVGAARSQKIDAIDVLARIPVLMSHNTRVAAMSLPMGGFR
jgi:hypothetical protein